MPQKGRMAMPHTVQKLTNVYLQPIFPPDFGIFVCNCPKREVDVAHYFNLGFFAKTETGTIPVGNLADSGIIYSQSKDNPDWINVAKKPLTTIYVKNDARFGITKTDRLDTIEDLKTAVSGIPVLEDKKPVTMEEIRQEGYFGNELSKTWHGFLGIRGSELVYAAFHCDFESMPWVLLSLGMESAVKLDGGGSFVLWDETEVAGTAENRVINNVGMWSL